MTRIEKVLEGLNEDYRKNVERILVFYTCPNRFGFEINEQECDGYTCEEHWNQEVDGE